MGDLVKLIKKCVKKGPLTITAIAAKLSVSTEEISEIIKKKPKKFHLDGETVCASASLEVTPPPSPPPKQKKEDKKGKKEKKRKIEEVSPALPAVSSAEDEKASKKKAKKEAKKAAKKKASSASSSSSSSSSSASSSSSSSSSFSSSTDADTWRSTNKIVVMSSSTPQPPYTPYRTFDHIKTVKTLQPIIDLCSTKGFTNPTPIQAQCWPILMEANKDIVGIAETGSGKTLAFGVPGIKHILDQKKSNKKIKGPHMLVLAPTRELANQSHEVLEEYGFSVGLKSMVIYGGIPKFEQKKKLAAGVDIVVATPGRLKDLMEEGVCDLSNVSFMCLDEADRMLDLGFEEEVRYIISTTKSNADGRQTAMFSATWPKDVQDIAAGFMNDPVRVYVGFETISADGQMEVDDSLSANKRVSQTVEVIEDREREFRLKALLKQYHTGQKGRVLVFALYKKEAARIEQMLARNGWNCSSIHGDKSQDMRTKALEEFKSCKCPLLVATDVAARGLDIPDVELVINYTFPLTIEDYVHRIGRTGRAGKLGMSYTFFQPGDKSHAGELQAVMKQAGQDVPESLMAFGNTIKKKEHKLYGNFGPRGGGPMKKATKITF